MCCSKLVSQSYISTREQKPPSSSGSCTQMQKSKWVKAVFFGLCLPEDVGCTMAGAQRDTCPAGAVCTGPRIHKTRLTFADQMPGRQIPRVSHKQSSSTEASAGSTSISGFLWGELYSHCLFIQPFTESINMYRAPTGSEALCWMRRRRSPAVWAPCGRGERVTCSPHPPQGARAGGASTTDPGALCLLLHPAPRSDPCAVPNTNSVCVQ